MTDTKIEIDHYVVIEVEGAGHSPWHIYECLTGGAFVFFSRHEKYDTANAICSAMNEKYAKDHSEEEITLDEVLSAQANAQKIQEALQIIEENGGTDGAHHLRWVLDQVVRYLTHTPENYEAWVTKYKYGALDPEDAEATGEYYEWDTGIAP